MTMPATQIRPSARRQRLQEQVMVASRWEGQLMSFFGRVRALPNPIDSLEREFGADIYDQMMKDATVKAGVLVLQQQIMAHRVMLEPAVPAPTKPRAPRPAISPVDPDSGPALDPERDAQHRREMRQYNRDLREHERAMLLRDFCQHCLDGLQVNIHDVMMDLALALAYGYRVAELVYRYANEREMARYELPPGALVLKAIKVKPSNSTAFVVDPYWNLMGLVARRNLWGQIAVKPEEVLDPDRFLIVTWREREHDPRGISDLRHIYSAWWGKMQAWAELLKYLAQFAGPSLIALLESVEAHVPEIDEDGLEISLLDEVFNALVAIRSHSVAVLPAGVKELMPLVVSGQGEAHLNAIAYFDRQIRYGLNLNELAGAEGQHNARAAAEVHQDQGFHTPNYGRIRLTEALHDDALQQLVLLNYGEDWEHLTPVVTLGGAEQQDMAVMLTAYAKAGYSFSADMFPALDNSLGLPERSEHWQDEAAAMAAIAPNPGQQDEDEDE
jgi:hypothetical protein